MALHLRLLELQQAVAGVGHHVGNGGAEDGQVGAVVGGSLAPGKLDDAPAEVRARKNFKIILRGAAEEGYLLLEEVGVGGEHPAGLQAAHRGGQLHLRVGVIRRCGRSGLHGAHRTEGIGHVGVAHEAEGEGDLLWQAGGAGGHDGVRGVQAVEGEGHGRAQAEEAALSGEALLVVAATGVVGSCDHQENKLSNT